MRLHLQLPQVPEAPSNQLHPVVHVAAAALLIWFVAAAWLLFGGSGYIELALAVIGVLVFMVIAIPAMLWRVRETSSNTDSTVSNGNDFTGQTQPLGLWLQGEFMTYSGREKSSAAVVEMLLPIAAVAFGITALGIVFDLARASVI
jgi:hypothetical protein